MRSVVAAYILVLLGGCGAGISIRDVRQGSDGPQVCTTAAVLREYALTKRYSAGRPRSIKLTPDGSFILYLKSKPDSSVLDLYAFDTAAGTERMLLTAEKILGSEKEELTVEEKARRERMRITSRGIVSYELSRDGSKILVPLSNRLFVVGLEDGGVHEIKSDHGFPIDAKFSPDGARISSVRNHEIHVYDLDTNSESRLTHDAGDKITNGEAEFVAQEEMGRHSGYWWSPDSTRIVYQQTDNSELEMMYIADALHPEKPPNAWPYPRPGKKNAAVKLGIMPSTGGDTSWINWDQDRYPYLATVKWKENAPLTLLVQNRRQTEQALLEVDPDTGSTVVLLTEVDPAWINLDQSMPMWLPDGSGFLWTSERNGAWQVELRGREGKLLETLTPPEPHMAPGVFMHARKDGLSLWYNGSGNPTESHVYRVDYRNGGKPAAPRRLTSDSGSHAFSFSRGAEVFVHRATLMDGTQSITVHRADGTTIGEIRSNARKPPFVPQLELTTVGRQRKMHAAIIRPRNFQEGNSYPVIVYVYGGPHAKVVQADPMRYFRQQWLADHGFIVVALDGRGTPGRGREWERAIKGDLIDKPLEDQVEGLRALGAEFPEMDLSRVGIYGWSFGGYFSAMAVLMRPDIYHVGIAGAPVTDWLDYDTHYTERYMDLPSRNEEGYEAASALTYADQLSRPLLLIHGSADDNVYFKHSLNLSRALFAAGKSHDMLVLSGFTHLVTGPKATPNLYGQMAEYFIEHLY
ncbi:MAG: S9 family peptidase [Planctomycetota bacterium]